MRTNDIAIVGMECVLPGAKNLAQYWENLVQGVDAIREIPPGRLNGIDRLPPEYRRQIPCTHGGFLPEDLRFDPLQFGVMPTIVPHGDPDQFLMLQVIDAALADAGVAPDSPLRRRTDVIVGRGGYISPKTSEVYYRSDLVYHLLDYLRRRLPQLGKEEFEQLAADLRAGIPQHDVDSAVTCLANLTASRAANRLDLRGTAYVVDAACASSLVAVEHAVQRLRHGLCDLAVACGIFLGQAPFFWFMFTELGAMSPSQQIRPFDRRADGLLIGEGAGAVILKRAEDACRDGDRVYALIKGISVSGDGRDTHILSASCRGQIAALRGAYQDAEVDPVTVGYLEAHGTATVAGDLTELKTIKSFYGTRDKFPPYRAMGSVKSMIGHTMPAAGIASLVKTALCLSNKCLVPSLHCDEPHPELHDAPFYVNRETRPWIHGIRGVPRRAGVSAFGFGGVNAHVVLEEVCDDVAEGSRRLRPRPLDTGPKRPSELVLLSAPSAEALAQRLRRLERFLQPPHEPALEDLAFTLLDENDFSHPHKLALVAKDVPHLRQLVAAALAQIEGGAASGQGSEDRLAANGSSPRLPNGSSPRVPGAATPEDEGRYYSADAAEPIGKVAGIFPGIGFPGLIGNYPDHLMELSRHFPEVRQVFDQMEWRDRHPEDPIPTSLIFCPPSIFSDSARAPLRNRIAAMKVIEGADGREIVIPPWERNIAAACVTLTNWACWVLLKNLGVPMKMACGQSQGEISALCAAGVVDVNDVVPRLWQALDAPLSYANKGRLAIIHVSEERMAPYLAESPDTAIAIHVAPEMLIIGGGDAHVLSIAQRFRAQGVFTLMLPYPPIHTPRVSHMRDDLRRLLDMSLRLLPAKFPVYSAITVDLFPDEEEGIRELALNNLDRPVRFWQTIHRMYAEGARVFVQVGGGTLASSIRTILPKPDIVGTAVDVDHRHPITQLQHLCATLFAAGVRFDPSYLYRHRSPRKLDLDAPPPPAPSRRSLLPLRMDWNPLPVVVDAPKTVQEGELPANDFPQQGGMEISRAAEQSNDSAQPSADEAPVMPLLGQIVHWVEGKEICTERVLDLSEDLFLQDHALIDESSGKPVELCRPILSMSVMMELAAETAVCLAPGLGVIGLERITALRWIDFADTQQVRVSVQARLEAVHEETGVHRVAVEILSDGQRSASLTVLLGSAYREDVALHFTELSNAQPWPLTVEEGYAQRYLFHGPAFQCLSRLDALSDRGLTAEITVLPKDRLFASLPNPQLLSDPVVLDGVAQLLGLWANVHGVFLMPAKISKLEFYGPTPPPGTRVPARIEVREMTATGRTVIADAEVQDGSGEVWFRFQGFHGWTYEYSQQLQGTLRLPRRHHLAEASLLAGTMDGAVLTLLDRDTLRHSTLEFLGRLFLHESEWKYLQSLKVAQRQWQWLMGRIAVKDAVRLYLAREMGSDMIHPARLLIAVEETGKPFMTPLEGWPPMPEMSIAHSDGWVAALAADVSCGIDIEPAARDVSVILPQFAGADELDLIRRALGHQPEELWPLRLWCAKESLGKALGTGLSGRPDHFQAIDLEADGRLLLHHRPTESTYTVYTTRDELLVMAWTSLSQSGATMKATHKPDRLLSAVSPDLSLSSS
jgi:acyl transferase domain-containing protein/phosphopantetheinyl transferase